MPSYNVNYTTDQQEWLCYFLKKIIDYKNQPLQLIEVGANKGILTDCMISVVKDFDYMIHAFEPNPGEYKFLYNKYKNNHRIKLWQDVVGESNLDSVKFNYSLQRSGGSYLYHSPVKDELQLATDWSTIDRRQVTIDSIVNRTMITPFIKTDAEGHDFFILKGSQWTLENLRPFVLFEFSGKSNCNDYQYSPKDWYEFFKDNLYDLIAPMGGRDLKFILSHFNSFHPDLGDILAIPLEKKHLLL